MVVIGLCSVENYLFFSLLKETSVKNGHIPLCTSMLIDLVVVLYKHSALDPFSSFITVLYCSSSLSFAAAPSFVSCVRSITV